MESTINNTKLKPLKILIVDDDEPTRMLLTATIAQWGYELIEASNGEEAWDVIQKKNPDLVIVDWLMPKMDGIELCKIARNELSYRPYIIMLTQVANTSNIIKALDAGADEFLNKPFNIAELQTRILVGIRILKYETTIIEQITKMKMYQYLVKEALNSMENFIENIPKEDNFFELNQHINNLRIHLKKMIALN